VAQLDKAMTVAKLRGARERKKRLTGQVRGPQKHLRAAARRGRAGARAASPEAEADVRHRDRAGGAQPSGRIGQAVEPSVVARMLRA